MSDSASPGGLAGLQPQRGPHDFDELYAGTPPWDIGRPQTAFSDLADSGILHGRLLDVGCGTGEHALMAAALGLEAVGIDTAPAAIATAQRKARDRGLTARFAVADALELASLAERFDTVLDCGLFHVFEDDDRVRFVHSLGEVVPRGGRYFMLCFSDHQPGDWGPRRVSQQEITESFNDGWRIDSIDAARIDINISPDEALAWFAAITRT